MRGLNTFNLFKRIIWSCVTDNSSEQESDEKQVNLPLLLGLLDEIKNEIYVESVNIEQKDDITSKSIELGRISGYTNYNPPNDHDKI